MVIKEGNSAIVVVNANMFFSIKEEQLIPLRTPGIFGQIENKPIKK
jgi:hypothetical protein